MQEHQLVLSLYFFLLLFNVFNLYSFRLTIKSMLNIKKKTCFLEFNRV